MLLPLARVHRSFWPWHRSQDWRREAVDVVAVVAVAVTVAVADAEPVVEAESEAIVSYKCCQSPN